MQSIALQELMKLTDRTNNVADRRKAILQRLSIESKPYDLTWPNSLATHLGYVDESKAGLAKFPRTPTASPALDPWQRSVLDATDVQAILYLAIYAS